MLACGAGTDRIAPSGSDGLIGRDCEQVGLVPAGAGARVAVLDDGFASARLRRHGNAVRIGLRLPSRTNGKLYHVHATVRSGGRTIGRATLRTRAGRGRLQQRTIVVHVNRRGAFHANVTIASSLFSIHFRAPVNGG